MKLTDYVVEFLADRGVDHVFGLTGGAVVHLFDSADRSGRLQPIFSHHEQASAFAAQAYARVRNGLGACFVTTGPGATNAITGLTAAWLDSVPCFYVSGQARLSHSTRHKKIRQLGTQEIDIVDVVESLTNYAVMLESADDIRYVLERAYSAATTGRPGPVWIDIPLDLQWAEVEPDKLRGFTPETVPGPSFDEQAGRMLEMLRSAERPLVLVGSGVTRADAKEELAAFIDRFDVPFVTTWGACDLLPSAHPRYVGRPGIAGQRGANLAIQNCDLLVALGSHLCIPVTGTMFEAFARAAKVVVVDVDPDELQERTVRVDLPIQADARDFLALVLASGDAGAAGSEKWRAMCTTYHQRYNAPPVPL